MSCDNVQPLISQFLDQRLAGEKRETVVHHLAVCPGCAARADSMNEMRAALRRMQSVQVPSRLAAELRLAASQERIRQLSRRTLGDRLRGWLGYIRITVDDLMRPLALPFAGGVFSAFLLFSALVPTLAFQRNPGLDVPIALFTDPALEEIGNWRVPQVETVLELTVAERGRVTDYSATQGNLTPEMVNDLLFYRFTPATAFGQPTWGKVIVTFRRSSGASHIVVRG